MNPVAVATRKDIDEVLDVVRDLAQSMHTQFVEVRADISDLKEEVRLLRIAVDQLKMEMREVKDRLNLVESEQIAVRNNLKDFFAALREAEKKVETIHLKTAEEQRAFRRELDRLNAWAQRIGERAGFPFPLQVT